MNALPEFTFADNPHWSNLDAWRAVQPSGDAILLDPATGDDLGIVHRWLRADPRLDSGVRFLHKHANDIVLTVVRGDHADASPDSMARRMIAQSDVAGIEGLGAWVQDGPGPSQTDDVSIASKVAGATDGGTPIFRYDASARSPVQLDHLVSRMAVFWHPAYADHPERPGDPVERMDWSIVHDALRESYILGSYGHHLQRRWRSLGARPVRACLTIGTLHESIPDLFRRTGMQVEDMVEPDEAPPTDMGRIMGSLIVASVRSGRIPGPLRRLAKWSA